MSESILKTKSYDFAIKIVKLAQHLVSEKKEVVLSKQILKSGTSIGAMIREAEFGQSKADFINKLSISLKEANETEYWLNILHDTQYIDNVLFISFQSDCKELIAILVTSIKTAKKSIK